MINRSNLVLTIIISLIAGLIGGVVSGTLVNGEESPPLAGSVVEQQITAQNFTDSILPQVNAYRCQQGMNPLVFGQTLYNAGAEQVVKEATADDFDNLPDGMRAEDRAIAAGYTGNIAGMRWVEPTSAEAFFAAWRNSLYANMNPRWNEFAIVMAYRPNSRYANLGYYWVGLIGANASVTPPSCGDLGLASPNGNAPVAGNEVIEDTNSVLPRLNQVLCANGGSPLVMDDVLTRSATNWVRIQVDTDGGNPLTPWVTATNEGYADFVTGVFGDVNSVVSQVTSRGWLSGAYGFTHAVYIKGFNPNSRYSPAPRYDILMLGMAPAANTPTCADLGL